MWTLQQISEPTLDASGKSIVTCFTTNGSDCKSFTLWYDVVPSTEEIQQYANNYIATFFNVEIPQPQFPLSPFE